MTDDLQESIFETLAERTPFPVSDIKAFMHKYKSLDLLLATITFSAQAGAPLYNFIGDIMEQSPESAIPTFKHEWVFDYPWEFPNLKDWFYMCSTGYIAPTVFLHIRILGVRSLWTFSVK